jgi:3-hydroxyisobutyrate dehydrogenase-like beta-hydroxyacid dehydrogenase
MTSSDPVVGFVGAGQIGLPMVTRLALAGYPPLTYVRRDAVADQITAAGARPVRALSELAGADIVFICVFTAEQLTEVLLGAGGLRETLGPGATVASHVTAGRSVVEKIAADLAEAGIEFVDAPFSGTDKAIMQGQLTVMLGGAETAIARVRPLIATYASTMILTGAVGTATALKLINNAVFGANIQLAAQAVHWAEAEGVAPDVAMAAIGSCSGGSAALSYMQAGGGPAPFADQVLPYLRKDVAAVREYAAQSGANLGVIDTTIASGPLTLT